MDGTLGHESQLALVSHVSAGAGERDRTVHFAVVGERVDVVLGGDSLRVTQQLGHVGKRASALVVERATSAAQPMGGRSAASLSPCRHG
jgi:hypothetical protein